MVEVSYHCPYCGAVTSLEREGYLADRCVTRDPLDGWAYASTTDDYDDADGVEIVCLGNVDVGRETPTDDSGGSEDRADGSRRGEGGADDPDPGADGCGRTFYLSFVRYEDGRPVEPDVPPEDYPDRPRFDFRP